MAGQKIVYGFGKQITLSFCLKHLIYLSSRFRQRTSPKSTPPRFFNIFRYRLRQWFRYIISMFSVRFVIQFKKYLDLGVFQMRTLLLICACKMTKYAHRGVKNGQILRTSFMDGSYEHFYENL